MSDMDITGILDDLASGKIDAAEAKKRIDSVGLGDGRPVTEPVDEVSTEWPTLPKTEPKAEATTTEPTQAEIDGEAEPAPAKKAAKAPKAAKAKKATPPKADKINGVKKVLVKATGRKVRIVADDHVSTAAAEDVHQVKRNGATLEILGDRDFPGVTDAIAWVRSVKHIDDLKDDIKGLSIGKELTVRVNPSLEVDIDVSASSLIVTDIPHLGKVRLMAGQATITGASVVSDLMLQAGQVSVSGTFTQDWSRIRCESGQVVLVVDPDSDVVVRADAQLGRIAWEGVEAPESELILGNGTAHLDLGVVLGHGVVRVAEPEE
ncbi:MAG: hypothetical protein LBN10_06610 [Propionibacteriaceae bacterium]|jgi:hypothetical protein|nr:hypothetical protein [Propionibacteriaceae bacterium]